MQSKAIRLGITGGIGSGKTYVCGLFRSLGCPVFDTDTSARRLMSHDDALRRQLRALVSPDAFPESGLNKPLIRQFLHASPANAARFDALVHPAVRADWKRWNTERTEPVIVMECALLFEADFQSEVDRVVAVTAPEDVRVSRVMNRDHIEAPQVRRWIAMQMPDEEKARRADFVIHNAPGDHPEAQVEAILRQLGAL